MLLCFVHRNRFADKQIVRLQETPDQIPEGGTPHTVSLLMHDKLVDAAKPGDRIEVRRPFLIIMSTIVLVKYVWARTLIKVIK